MTAGGPPLTQVYLDDGSGTFPYEITTKVRVGRGVTRGRQDELASVTAGQLSLILDNNDGRFTLGSTTIASPSPIKVDQRIRIKDTPGGNLLTADQASFETATGGFAFNTLFGARDAGTSIAQSALHPTDGTKSLLVTWSTTVLGNVALIAVPTTIGQTYTFAMDVWVPVGSPDVHTTAAFIVNGPTVSTKGSTVRTSVTFTATAASTSIGIECLTATAGQQCFIDSLTLTLGTTALPFAPGGLTVTRFTGYVQQWPVAWPSGSDVASLVQVTATDAQARAERQILRSVIEEEFAKDALAALYGLAEPSASTSAADTSGNQLPSLTATGTGTAVVFGTAGPPVSSRTAATFAVTSQYLSANVPTVNVASALCVFSATTAGSNGGVMLNLGGAGLFTFIGIDGTGHVTFGYLTSSSTAGAFTSVGTYFDGLYHTVEIRYSGTTAFLLVDGVVLTSAASTAASHPVTSIAVGSLFTGNVADVALFSVDPGAARATAHATAVSNGFTGEAGTARLTRDAGYANVPVGTLDTSLTNVGFSDITGKSVAEALRQVADAEMGLVFFDGSGNLTFHNRTRAVSKVSPDLTLTADVLDPGTTFVVDMQGVLNRYTVTATGTNVAQLARSTTSETTHGAYPGSATYMVQTDAEALDRGNWIVSTHAEPSPRVGTLVIDTMVLDAATQASLLALEPNSWVRISGLPSQAPGGTTADFIVQGFADAATKDSWSIAFNAANKAVAAPTPWILDNATYSVLDSTTRIYV